MADKVYLAVDLGAGSGRVLAVIYDGERITLEEIHRFPNDAVRIQDTWHWDLLRLWYEIKQGLAKAVSQHGDAIVSVGVDTWGVDYSLIDKRGKLLENPTQYRDSRTDGMMEEAFSRAGKEEMYAQTGAQFIFINTVYQLLSEVVNQTTALKEADRLLFIPDLLNYWLTGVKCNEMSIASTSQMYNPQTGDWAWDLLDRLGIPRHLFGNIVQPGHVLGKLQDTVAEEVGAALTVVAPGTHDTASAVAAVPVEVKNFVYVSSGTWSLMGIESPGPVITDRSRELSFTNEGGVCDTVRVLKNICGMWLVQESQRTWAAGGESLDFPEMVELARAAEPFTAFIFPDHSDFATPGDMPARVQEFCRRTGQRVPQTKGQILRICFESLAFRYRTIYGMLEELAGERLDVMHVVGGGSQNELLNQFTANAIDRPVITGPIEATSAGNALIQMLAAGDISSLSEGREIIRRSFETRTYEPGDTDAWAEAYPRYLAIED
jgi:sugar (pentulose or hexulose) kinase